MRLANCDLRRKIQETSNDTTLEAKPNEIEAAYRIEIDVIRFGSGTQLNMGTEESRRQQQQRLKQTTRGLLRELEKEIRR